MARLTFVGKSRFSAEGRWLWSLLSAAALVGLLPCVSGAKTEISVDRARSEISSGQYELAFKELSKLAAKGDREACCALGDMYEKGQGVKADQETALLWYRKGAELVEEPCIVPENPGCLDSLRVGAVDRVGLDQMKQSASNGDALAQYKLGYMYVHGIGLPFNEKLGLELYAKACEQGLADAQNALGFVYQYGLGRPKNAKEAVALYEKAIAKEHPGAQNNLAFAYLKGLGGVSRDPQKALELFEKAAAKGEPHALYNLGYLYQQGEIVGKDYKKAHSYYLKAAAHGLRAAKCRIEFDSVVAEDPKIAADEARKKEVPEDREASVLEAQAALYARDDESLLGFMEYLGRVSMGGQVSRAAIADGRLPDKSADRASAPR